MLKLSDSLNAQLIAFETRFEAVQNNFYPSDETLHQACRYALAGQGKRIRPLFVIAAAEALGAFPNSVLNLAVAVEMIHTYSLVHDDLPCMDDDELRRGRATTHIIFDEATALLAGDTLLTDAFFLIADDTELADSVRAKAVAHLARAAGGQGMVRGQALDMHWTGRGDFSKSDLDAIHIHKTGALIAASCILGGLAAGGSDSDLRRLEAFGRGLGLAFQIIDDLLDNESGTGKSAGKDADAGKLTYLSLMSRDEAHSQASKLTEETLALISPWGKKAEGLMALGRALLERKI